MPVYALTWCFSVIDDLAARISISLLVTMLTLAEFLYEPRPLKSRGEEFRLALFYLLALLLVASHEFDWHGLAGKRGYVAVYAPILLAGLATNAT